VGHMAIRMAFNKFSDQNPEQAGRARAALRSSSKAALRSSPKAGRRFPAQ
jgi:hypothetical protein